MEFHLNAIQYPHEETKFLVNGFREGFHLGHEGPTFSLETNNARKAQQQPQVVRAKLQAEIDAGRIAGPFHQPPFDPFQISPLNIREKKVPGKFRLIHDLSYPYNDQSINANIPDKCKTVKYASVRDAIKVLVELPKGAYMAKCDIADAYRLIPLHPSEHPKLGIKFQDECFYDTFLPQGCGSSCRIFETFSTAVQKIFEHINPSHCLHMIDDFLFITESQQQCEVALDAFMALCHDIGIPLAPDKTTAPSTQIVFLGITLDSISHTASLPQDKLEEYRQEVQLTLQRSKIRRSALESLIGKLNFAAAVVPARPFLRRLIDLLHSVKKPYYFIRCTQNVIADLQTWDSFLSQYNGITYFRSLGTISSDTINLASDASDMGFGACYGSQWIQAAYPAGWKKFHIGVKEIYPVYVLICMFGHLMKNNNIALLCDNSGDVDIINKQSSKCKQTMQIMRPLTLKLVEFNIHLIAKHIPGHTNVIPDRISRFQITKQLLKHHHMNETPTAIPEHLLPGNFNISWRMT